MEDNKELDKRIEKFIQAIVSYRKSHWKKELLKSDAEMYEIGRASCRERV